MSQDLDAIYTAEWYAHDFAHLAPEFAIVAKGIDRWARVRGIHRRALDLGCGPGMLVAGLREQSWDVYGADGSTHAIEYARQHVPGADGRIWQADIRKMQAATSRYDVVICTEVAEHLDAADAPHLVEVLATTAAGAIIMTAAPPGQDGHHHVNCQPQYYWLDLFAAHGWIIDAEGTIELRARWCKLQRLSHMTQNLMVMK